MTVQPRDVLPGNDYVDRRSGLTWQATKNTTGSWDYISLAEEHPRIVTVEAMRASKRAVLVPVVPLPHSRCEESATALARHGVRAASVMAACLHAAQKTLATRGRTHSAPAGRSRVDPMVPGVAPLLAGRPMSWETQVCARLLEQADHEHPALVMLYRSLGDTADLASTIYTWATGDACHIPVPDALGAIFSRVVDLLGGWDNACDPNAPCGRWMTDHAQPWLTGASVA